jgi:hypothetical protein
MDYEKIPISDMRGMLLKKCEKHVAQGLSITKYPVKVAYVYREFWRRWVVCYIVRDYFEKNVKPQNDKEEYALEENIEFWNALLCKDMNRLILDSAVYSWLTIDTFRWHEYFEDPDIPTDISYELVTQQFPLLSRIGSFACGLTEYLEYEGLDEESREMAKDYALESTLNCLSGKMEKDEILLVTSKLKY